MEERENSIEPNNLEVFKILPMQRIIPILLIEISKERDKLKIYEQKFKKKILVYMKKFQDNCVTSNHLANKINNFNIQYYFKILLPKLVDEIHDNNELVKKTVKQAIINVPDEEVQSIIVDTNYIYTLAVSGTNTDLQNLKEFMAKQRKNKRNTNILFFSLCLFVRRSIIKDFYKQIIEFFLKADVDINSHFFYKKRTPLLEIILNGHRGIGKILLLNKKVPEAQITFMLLQTPEKIRLDNTYNLEKTKQIREIHTNIVNLFLKYRADIEAKDLNGCTALIQATNLGIFEIIELLVEKYKANLENQDKNGNTALLIAVYNSNKEIVEYLLKNEANSNKVNSEDFTPLKIVIAKSNNQVQNSKDKINYQIAELLLKYEANTRQLDKQNKTPLKLAQSINKDPKLYKLLLEYTTNFESEKQI